MKATVLRRHVVILYLCLLLFGVIVWDGLQLPTAIFTVEVEGTSHEFKAAVTVGNSSGNAAIDQDMTPVPAIEEASPSTNHTPYGRIPNILLAGK